MKNALWITAIVLAFVAGYFTRGASQSTSPASPQAEITQPINKAADAQVSSEQLSAAAKAVFAAKEKAAPKVQQIQNTPEPQTGAAVAPKTAADPAQVVDSNNPTVKKYPNEISDEDIDKFIPVPFNRSLKNTHGDIREKYKDFVQASTANDWDINMQHKLMDFILSRPYAKFIDLDFLICKAGMCEIRLYENKNGAWGFILSEMALQDWWDIGNYSSSGQSPKPDEKAGTSYLVLLTRKPAQPQ